MTNIFNTFKKCDKHSCCFPTASGKSQTLFLLIMGLVWGSLTMAADVATEPLHTIPAFIEEVKSTIKTRKYKWDLSVFRATGWESKGTSVNHRPLIYYTCGSPSAINSSLILSNVHGDEVTPVYFGFRFVEWLKSNPEICQNRFVIVAPMVNPDGFMRYTKGTRTNFNKVDINRNFDTPEWNEKALAIWKKKFKERRYYPGDKAASEPETLFQKWLIDEYHPSKILSVHAPLNFLDYDGPQSTETMEFSKSYVDSCESLKSVVKKAATSLEFYAYGIFPGSLGNYAGKQRGIPTFTVELPTTDSTLAAKYFGDLENGTELFIRYELKDTHLRTTKK